MNFIEGVRAFQARLIDAMDKHGGRTKGDDGLVGLQIPNPRDEYPVRVWFGCYPMGPTRRYQFESATLENVLPDLNTCLDKLIEYESADDVTRDRLVVELENGSFASGFERPTAPPHPARR